MIKMTTVVEFYISDKDRNAAKRKLNVHFDDSVVKEIEKGCYDYTEQYCRGNKCPMSKSVYHDTVDNLLFNCNQNHNTIKRIKKMCKRGQYNAYNLAFLRPDELDEDNWMKIKARKLTTEEKLNNLPTITWKACYICKSNEYLFYQLQTRSSDEPMTTYYKCKKCDKVYKVNS